MTAVTVGKGAGGGNGAGGGGGAPLIAGVGGGGGTGKLLLLPAANAFANGANDDEAGGDQAGAATRWSIGGR